MVEPSQELQLVFDKSITDAKKLRHEYVTIEHLLFSDPFYDVIKEYGADVDYIKSHLEHHLKEKCDELKIELTKYKPKKTQAVERVLNRAFTQVLFAGRNTIELVDVMLSIMSEKKSISNYFLEQSGLKKDTFAEYINAELETSIEDEEMSGEAQRALRQFTTDLNQEVVKEKIDPVIGREAELDTVYLLVIQELVKLLLQKALLGILCKELFQSF
jgi:ATP-dependent Clp protease ATP-binding subunit ClpA